MTDTPAHTPLRLSAGDETRIMDNRGYPLLDVKCGGMTGRTVKEGEQIAAFIVRACNSHYQLVEALRALLEDAHPEAYPDARAALSQAGGAGE
mgnify:CR=1 FL=1